MSRRFEQSAASKGVAGVTLTEMLVTVSVGAVLAAVALPNFAHALQSMRATSATNSFVADVLAARSLALRIGQSVVLCRSVTSSRSDAVCSTDVVGTYAGNDLAAGWILFQDTNADGQRQLSEPLLRVNAGEPSSGSRTAVFAPAAWSGRIAFDGNGLATGGVPSPFHVALASGGPTLRCISLTALGAPTVVRGPCAA
jgi:type IV fimbrial biogenesis protein FimT